MLEKLEPSSAFDISARRINGVTNLSESCYSLISMSLCSLTCNFISYQTHDFDLGMSFSVPTKFQITASGNEQTHALNFAFFESYYKTISF